MPSSPSKPNKPIKKYIKLSNTPFIPNKPIEEQDLIDYCDSNIYLPKLTRRNRTRT
eukprot:UN19977